ncbi:hypothetical protein G902_00118 [Escherichia coli UMEA 3052-1]|nr:hypothetical protein G902_00118 [Escherichia coli UMEA 3052-1]
MNWHYENNGVRHDNVTEADITERIQRGELNASTLVWQQGMTEWQPLSATPLADVLKQCAVPPALPGNRIPGSVVWTLAFAPLIGYALEMWTAGLSGMEFEEAYAAVTEGQYWFITLILNIALGYLDERRLRKSGVDTAAFGWPGWFRFICGVGQKPSDRNRLTSGSGWSR